MNRGFYTIMCAQFLSSLADNALLIAAIALLTSINAPDWMTPLLKLFFVVSYVCLAAWVGIFADSMPKGRVMFLTNFVKAVGCLLMLSEASVQNVELTPSGEWLRCEVQLTMQQSGSGGTSSSGGGSGSGGGGGGSSKKSSLIKDNQAIVDFMKSQREKFNSTKDKIKAKRLSDFLSSKAGQKLSSLAKKNAQTTAKEGALARCTKDVNQTISAGKKASKGKITIPGSTKFMMIKKD